MLIPTLLTAATLLPLAQEDAAPKTQKDPDAAVVAAQLPSYPLETCVVSGEELDSMDEPVDLVVEGRLVRLCCKMCVKQVEADPEKHIQKIDAAVVRAQTPSYPLDKCVISGEPLDSMGEPVDVVVGTRLVRLCCGSCKKSLMKDPRPHLKRIDVALIEAQRKTYPLTTCVVSGEELGSMGEPVDLLYGTRLVRLCCGSCKKSFHKDPEKFLAEVAKARKAADEGGGQKKEG